MEKLDKNKILYLTVSSENNLVLEFPASLYLRFLEILIELQQEAYELHATYGAQYLIKEHEVIADEYRKDNAKTLSRKDAKEGKQMKLYISTDAVVSGEGEKPGYKCYHVLDTGICILYPQDANIVFDDTPLRWDYKLQRLQKHIREEEPKKDFALILTEEDIDAIS